MMIDRALGDDELLSNLAVGQPLGDQERHLLLAGGEQLGSIAERWVLLEHGDESWSLALLFFREGVLYGRLQPHSPPLCQPPPTPPLPLASGWWQGTAPAAPPPRL